MRPYNFSPGPAVLPTEVLEQAREELLDWNGSGMSVMEVSHRGKAFMRVAAEAEADLRELMAVPRNYKILFLQGGASAQFAIVPLNLTRLESVADYIDTGHWSKKAIAEARRYCTVHVAGDAGGDVPAGAAAERARAELRSGLCALHAERDHQRRRVQLRTRRRRACRWSPTCPRASCRGPSMCPSSA